jgi:hypothetical protein
MTTAEPAVLRLLHPDPHALQEAVGAGSVRSALCHTIRAAVTGHSFAWWGRGPDDGADASHNSAHLPPLVTFWQVEREVQDGDLREEAAGPDLPDVRGRPRADVTDAARVRPCQARADSDRRALRLGLLWWPWWILGRARSGGSWPRCPLDAAAWPPNVRVLGTPSMRSPA